MSGETNLTVLIASMSPELQPEEYVFYCSVSRNWQRIATLEPKAVIDEKEGLTIVLTKSQAQQRNITFEQTYRCITLTIHSSLDAVGLTAAFSAALATNNISANVIAGYYHDHIFVKANDAHLAMTALVALTQG